MNSLTPASLRSRVRIRRPGRAYRYWHASRSRRYSCSLIGRVEDVGFARVELARDATDDPVAHVCPHDAFERVDSENERSVHLADFSDMISRPRRDLPGVRPVV